MLHSFSFGELALIFGIILVLFGGSRLASIGKSLGEGISNFKKGLNSPTEEKPQSNISQPANEPKLHVVQSTQLSSNHQDTDSHLHQGHKNLGQVVDIETKG